MKKLSKSISVALSAFLFMTGFAACGNGGGDSDIELGSDGLARPGAGGKETKIVFWGVGNDNEVAVFQNLVKEFNKLYDGTIEVKYEAKTDGDYEEAVSTALMQSKASVDVLYVKEPEFKKYAEQGWLEPLDEYIENSQEVVIEDMWETSMNRYLYDVNTTTQDGPDAHYWGIPKDIGPTVIYYNETLFNQAGVKVLSVAAADLAAFNAGGEDARGNTKTELGLVGTVKEKGYFVDDEGQKWFNNQVPMSWEECVTLSTLLQDAIRPTKESFYGYFTEWWFNYGWSVGGDCIEYVATDDPAYNGGYWDFTLMDDTKNYIVADDNEDGFTVNGTKYNAGEIIAWEDKLNDTKATNKTVRSEILTAVTQGKLNELPSQREAFVEFVRVGQKTNIVVDGDLKGYDICPAPTTYGGDTGKANAFASGELGMLVDGRWSVVQFREQMDGKYNWDVAPLPMYKQYDANGDITVHGVEAGHSGSVALCINKKSVKKNAAWIFAEYIGGATGQSEQAKSGFAIPSQKAIANSEVFLQTNKNPKNSIVFVRAAEHQTPGDWWYLRDKAWTDDWADLLNGSVRNGTLTLSQFEAHTDYTKTWNLLKEYTKK